LKVNVYDLDGNVVGEEELPEVFNYPYRPDIIRRVVRAFQFNARQPYGIKEGAGMRQVGHNWGPGHGVARVPRRPDGSRAVIIGNVVGGRKAHAPTTQRNWYRKVNKKERKLAKFIALSATKNPELVKARGHIFREDLTLPVVVVDEFENIAKTKEGIEIMKKLGLYDDILRASRRKVRAGKGKARGRRYRRKKSVLVVVKNKENVMKALRNLPGVDILTPRELNAEVLAPGTHMGRLMLISKGALDEIRGWKM